MVAGLNSVEPVLFNVSEVEYFMDDEQARRARRPLVVRLAKERLAMLEAARAGRDWLVGDGFTIADLVLASILKIADRLALLDELPALAAWQRGILARPAHVRAEQDQRAEIARHTPTDMRYDALGEETAP